MAAAVQAPDVLVGHVGHHALEFGVLAEEVLAHIGAITRLVVLIVAVDRLHHAFLQQPVGVLRQQRIPVAAPQDLDHVPAGATEDRLQLLHDLAVAAHRAVQALQVAVHHPGQVIQLLARGQGNRPQGLRLVHLAVADKAPDAAILGLRQAPVLQIAHEARLVDAHDRAQAHGHGRELPEVRHQPGVRVGGQPLAIHLAAEVIQLLLGQAAFHERAGVDARRGVPLGEQQVAAVIVRRGMPEVVEPDVIQRRGGCEGRDMPAEFGRDAVGLDHHRHRIPADIGTNAVFHRAVARVLGFQVRGNGVDVGGIGRVREVGPAAARLVDQALQQGVRPFGAVGLQHGGQGINPLLGLLRVDIVFGRVRVHASTPENGLGIRMPSRLQATGQAGICYHAPVLGGHKRRKYPD